MERGITPGGVVTITDTSRAETRTQNLAPKRDLPPSMVERMTLILDAFEGRSSRLTLEDVACRTKLPRSTAHRILDQLVRLDWLEHGSAGYGLGGRALGLGGGDSGHGDLRHAAAPILHALSLRTGLVAHLAILEGKDVVYLDKVGGRFAALVPSRVGGRAPAHTTAVGKSMLAMMEPEMVDEVMESGLTRRTDRTITELPVFHTELNRVRQRRGLAYERGESQPGVACVASAVRGPDGPIAGMSLCGDIRTAQLERVAPLAIEAARAVSRALWPDMPEWAEREMRLAGQVRLH